MVIGMQLISVNTLYTRSSLKVLCLHSLAGQTVFSFLHWVGKTLTQFKKKKSGLACEISVDMDYASNFY